MAVSGAVPKSGASPLDSRGSWFASFAWMGIWFASVAVATGLAGVVVWFLRSSSTPTRADLDGWLWGSQELKVAALRDAYNGRRSLLVDPQQTEIQSFLDGIVQPIEDHQRDKWFESVDIEHFRQRLNRSPWVRSLSLIDRATLAKTTIPKLQFDLPAQFARIDIVRINSWAQKPGAATTGQDDKLVFTYAFRQNEKCEQLLFWVRKSGVNWKLVDWEWVESGLSEVEGAGLWNAVTRDKRGATFLDAFAQIQAADQLGYSDGNRTAQLLKLGESREIPDSIRDQFRYWLMIRWNRHYAHAEVRRIASQVADPDRLPAVHAFVAAACEATGEYKEALDSLTRFEELAGFSPDRAKSHARLLQRSHRRDDALAEWRRVSDFGPEDVEALSALQGLLQSDQSSEVFDRITSAREPVKLASQFVMRNNYQLTTVMLKRYLDFAKGIAPTADHALDIEALWLSKSNDHLAAAALHRKRAELQGSPESQSGHWVNFFKEMQKADELVAGFLEHPDPKAAFQLLVEGIDFGEGFVSVDVLPELLDAVREKLPGDPLLLYYEGYVAAERQRFVEARERFLAAKKAIAGRRTELAAIEDSDDPAPGQSDINSLDSLASQIDNQLHEIRYELGEDVEILNDSQQDEMCYQTLARLANEYRHWTALDRLNQSFEKSGSKNIWLPYYQACSLLGSRDFAGARARLQLIASRENEEPSASYYCRSFQRELDSAEFPDPLQAFLNSNDRLESFQHISQRLLVDRDWTRLDQLVDAYQTDPDDPDVALIRLEMAWRRGDDASLVERLTPWPTDLMKTQFYLLSSWRERLVRSLIRLGRHDEARERAAEMFERFDETWPLVMCDIAGGKSTAGIDRILESDDPMERDRLLNRINSEPDFRQIFLEPDFAELRAKYVFEMPYYSDSVSLTLLQSKPADMTESFLRQRLSDPEAAAESPLRISTVLPSTFVVEWRGTRFAISTKSEPFFSKVFLDNPGYRRRWRGKSAELHAMFRNQNASIRIRILCSDEVQPWNSPTVAVRELGARLIDENTVGAVNSPAYSRVVHVIRLNGNQSEQLASRRPFTELDPATIVIRGPMNERPVDRKLKKRLATLARTLLNKEVQPESTSASRIIIQVVLGQSDDNLSAPFRVIGAQSQTYGGIKLIGEYAIEDHFAGFPELRRGVRYAISLDQVISIEETAE